MTAASYGARTRGQWVRLAIGAVFVALLCLLAGWWQWNRYEFHDAQSNQLSSAYGAKSVPATELLPARGTALPSDDVWRSVSMHGHYEPSKTVLLRNRPVGDGPTYHVLVPFVIDASATEQDGTVIVVDRGTVPLANTNALEPTSIPAPPSGEITLDARLRADEAASTRTAPPDEVQVINTPTVLAAAPGGAGWADGRTVGAYAVMRSETPAPTTAISKIPAPDNDINPGVNLSYTIQWCIFAIGAVGAYIMMWRRERGTKLTAGDLIAGFSDPQDARRARMTTKDKAPRRPTDEDEEDAILDALGIDVRVAEPGERETAGSGGRTDARAPSRYGV
jgi:cytochrome oxidase assembly protein ShyY1